MMAPVAPGEEIHATTSSLYVLYRIAKELSIAELDGTGFSFEQRRRLESALSQAARRLRREGIEI